jgi:hypothetical protein
MIYEPGMFQKQGPKRQQRRAWGMEKEAGLTIQLINDFNDFNDFYGFNDPTI